MKENTRLIFLSPGSEWYLSFLRFKLVCFFCFPVLTFWKLRVEERAFFALLPSSSRVKHLIEGKRSDLGAGNLLHLEAIGRLHSSL